MAAPKIIKQTGGALQELQTVTTSTADGVVALDGSGKLNINMMPAGLGADIAALQASETLAAGDFINVHDVSGSARMRKADATTAGKEADGFVKSAVTSGATGDAYFEGTNDQVTGMTPGQVFLTTTAGVAGAAPSASGNVVQRLGVAISATAINFERGTPITLA